MTYEKQSVAIFGRARHSVIVERKDPVYVPGKFGYAYQLNDSRLEIDLQLSEVHSVVLRRRARGGTWRFVYKDTTGVIMVDGKIVPGFNSSWLSFEGDKLIIHKEAYEIDELLVFQRLVSEDELSSWLAMDSPFFDATPYIDATGQHIVIGTRMIIDQNGQRFFNNNGEVTIEFGREDGSGLFTGSVQANSIIIPVREA